MTLTLKCGAAQTLAPVLFLWLCPSRMIGSARCCSLCHRLFVLSVRTCMDELCPLYIDYVSCLYCTIMNLMGFSLSSDVGSQTLYEGPYGG